MGEVETGKIKRATAGFVFSLIGGGFNLFFGIVFFMSSITHHPSLWVDLSSPDYFVPPWFAEVEPSTLGAIVAIFGFIMMIGAMLIYMRKETIGGILVIALSIASLIILPITFFFDFVGVFGGALGLAKKTFSNL